MRICIQVVEIERKAHSKILGVETAGVRTKGSREMWGAGGKESELTH